MIKKLTNYVIMLICLFTIHTIAYADDLGGRFLVNLPTPKSEMWKAVTVTTPGASIEVKIEGEFESAVSFGVYTRPSWDSTRIAEYGMSLYASMAFTSDLRFPVYIEKPGTYWIYITNASNLNPHYYGVDGINTKNLFCEYKIVLPDKNENNDTMENATKLVANEKKSFTLNGTADIDYYKFTVYDLNTPLNIKIERKEGYKHYATYRWTLNYLNPSTGELERVDQFTESYLEPVNEDITLSKAGDYYLKFENGFNFNSIYYSPGDNPDTMYVTSNFGYEEKIDTSTLGDNQYLIKVYDHYGNITNQEVIVNHRPYKTDDLGYAKITLTAEDDINNLSVMIEADGHKKYYMQPFYVNTNTKVSYVKLLLEEESDYELQAVRFGKIDVLHETKKSQLRPDMNVKIDIIPYTEVGIGSYAIMQGNETLAESTHRIIEIKGGKFKPGKDIYTVLYSFKDKDGNRQVLSKTKLNINVLNINESLFDNFEVGKDIKMTINKNIPIVGSKELSYNFLSKNPITYIIDEDKIRVGINVDLDTTNAKNLFWNVVTVSDEEFPKDGIIKSSTNVALYAELQFIDGIFVNTAGNAKLSISLKGSGHEDFFFHSIPMTASFSVNNTLSFIADVNLNFHTNKVDYKTTMKNNFDLNASLGIGFEYLNVSGYVHTNFDFNHKNLYEIDNIIANIDGGIFIRYGIEEEKYKLYEKENWTLYDSNTYTKNLRQFAVKQVNESINKSSSDKKFINRSYLNNRSTYNGYTTGNTFKNQENVYPYIEPQIVNNQNKDIVMVYLDDNGKEDNYNFQHLVFSTYSSNFGWSNPVILDNSEFNQNSFYLYTDNHDIYIVYTRNKSKLTENIVGEEANKLYEIVTAKFDSNTKKFVNIASITANDTYDFLPRIAVINNIPIAVWVNNSENNYYGTNNKNAIYYSKYENNKWTSPTKLLDNLKAISDIRIGKLNNQVTIAYIEDIDNDITTVDDRKLKTVNLNKEVNTISIDINYNQYIDFINYENKDLLVYNSGDKLIGISKINDSEITIYEDKNLSTYSKIKIINNNDDQYVVSYIKPDNNGSTINYSRKKDGKWLKSQTVGDFSKIDEKYVSAYGIAMKDDTILTSQLNTKYDNLNRTSAIFNHALGIIYNRTNTNIEVLEITDKTAKIKVNISNNNEVEYNYYNLRISDNKGKKLYQDDSFNITLQSGENKGVELTFPVTEISDSDYALSYVASAGGAYGVESKFNLKYVDFETESTQITMNNKNYLSLLITNKGYYKSKSKLEIYKVLVNNDGTNNDVLIKTKSIDALGYNESTNLLIEVTNDYYPNGKNEGVIKLVVSPVEGVTELSKADNITSVAVTDFQDSNNLLKVNIPTPKKEVYGYTGKEIEFELDNFNSKTMNINGQLKKTEKGVYTYKVTLKDGYAWQDGTTNALTYTFKIVEETYQKGDMNKNGKIDLTDVLILLKLYFNKIGVNNDYYMNAGDMNNNNKIDLTDVLMLLKDYFN